MEKLKFFDLPTYLPTQWFLLLIGSVSTIVLAAVYLCLLYAGLKSEVIASQNSIIRINDDLKYRTMLRDKLMDRLNSIDQSLSEIKGRLGIAAHR